MHTTSTPPNARPAGPGTAPDIPDELLRLARRRNTVRLGAAGALLALYLGFVLLTTSTSVLSGRVAGLGTAYWAAFAIFAAVIVLAQVYTAWAKRLDDVIAPYREAGAGRAEGGAR